MNCKSCCYFHPEPAHGPGQGVCSNMLNVWSDVSVLEICSNYNPGPVDPEICCVTSPDDFEPVYEDGPVIVKDQPVFHGMTRRERRQAQEKWASRQHPGNNPPAAPGYPIDAPKASDR